MAAAKLTAARIKKLAANPGTRAAIPTKYLPAEYLKARQQAQLFKSQVAPGLTYGDVARQAKTDTDLQFGEAQRSLEGLQPKVTDWYQQYQKAIGDAAVRQKAVNDAAVAQIGQLQTGLNDSSKQEWAGQSQAMQADAASRGATVDPKLAQIAQNASNVRGVLTGSQGAVLAGIGANNQADYGNRGLAAMQQGRERQDVLGQQLKELLLKKGAFNVQDRSKIVSDANDSALKAALTRAQTGSTIATTAKTRAATTKTKADTAFFNKYGYYPSTSSPLDAAKLKFFNVHGYLPSTGDPKKKGKKVKPASGPGSLPAASEQKQLANVLKVAGLFKSGTYTPTDNSGVPIGDPVKGAAAIKRALAASGYDPRILDAAESVYRNKGAIGPNGVKKLHSLGVHVGGNFKVVKK